MELNRIYNEDCLEGMKRIPDGSVDMILCDLPYGTTACSWDAIIPFDQLWEQYERVIKDDGAIVLFGSEPFSSHLRLSNINKYKYDWVWDKKKAGNIFLAAYQPMKTHESISVFSKGKHNYFPIMVEREKIKVSKNYGTGETMGGKKEKEDKLYIYNEKYPISIIEFSNASQRGKFHPTQKPVALFEYLIRTYTNKNETVLDNCMGSGTTAIACMNTERNFIGFELDKTYYEKSLERIKEHTTQTDIFDVLEDN